MSRKELNDTLEAIEDEYTHDLALHLYSAHLLHRRDFSFPGRHWASWPLPWSEVPDPGTARRYASISAPLAAAAPAAVAPATRQRVVLGGLVTENLSDAPNELRLELASLVERKIAAKIAARRCRGETAPRLGAPVEVPADLMGSLVARLHAQVDAVLGSAFDARVAGGERPVRLLNWQDVMSAHVEAGGSVDVEWEGGVYRRLEGMFNMGYRYEEEPEVQESPAPKASDVQEPPEAPEPPATEPPAPEPPKAEASGTALAAVNPLHYDEVSEAEAAPSAAPQSPRPPLSYDALVEQTDATRRLALADRRRYADAPQWRALRARQHDRGVQRKSLVFWAALDTQARLQALSWRPRSRMRSRSRPRPSRDADAAPPLDESAYIT
ncbi:Rrn9 domain-containing protein [[Candida] zeylanoides]